MWPRLRTRLSRRALVMTAVAVACGITALAVAGAATAAARRAALAGMVDVPVAARALSEGSVLVPADVRHVLVPPDAAPPGVVPDPAGQVLTLALLPGDPVTEGKLAPSGRGLSALLAPGEVAATVVPSSPLTVAVGERVRVTATYDPQRFAGPDLVKVVAPAARVIALGSPSGTTVPMVVSLSSAERDRLSLAQATARIDVALVPPG